jgi:hypothetical protein
MEEGAAGTGFARAAAAGTSVRAPAELGAGSRTDGHHPPFSVTGLPVVFSAAYVDLARRRSTHGRTSRRTGRRPRKDRTMKVMVIVKATKNSEAGIMPSEKLLADMGKFNEELVKAGIMLAGDGLHPSAKGKRVKFSGGKRDVVDGPFAETKELIAGYWIWQVRTLEEAVEWARRCPDPMPGEDAELEIRPVFEAEDFGAEYTPELRAQDERLRAEMEQKQKQ